MLPAWVWFHPFEGLYGPWLVDQSSMIISAFATLAVASAARMVAALMFMVCPFEIVFVSLALFGFGHWFKAGWLWMERFTRIALCVGKGTPCVVRCHESGVYLI